MVSSFFLFKGAFSSIYIYNSQDLTAPYLLAKHLLFTLNILFASFLLTSCGGSIESEESTASYLDGKTLSFAGGDLVFHDDYTFTVKSPYPNDPTQEYTGTWSTSQYEKSKLDGMEIRSIEMHFSNFGQFTDGLQQGDLGVGHDLYGRLVLPHSMGHKDQITLKTGGEGMLTYGDGGFQSAKTEVSYDLK